MEVVLTDGGVYDNLGLETVWKSYTTVLASDGGGQMAPDPDPPADWAQHSKRVLDLIDNQVRSLRKRQLIDSYQLPAEHEYHRDGTYWGIRSHVKDYGLPAIPNYPFTPAVCDPDKTGHLANVSTRLKSLDEKTQERIVNWGTPSATWPCGGTSTRSCRCQAGFRIRRPGWGERKKC